MAKTPVVPEVKVLEPEEIAQAYQEVARTPAGRIMLRDLVARFGYGNRSTFDVNPHVTSYAEGQRSVAVHFSRMIDGVRADQPNKGEQ